MKLAPALTLLLITTTPALSANFAVNPTTSFSSGAITAPSSTMTSYTATSLSSGQAIAPNPNTASIFPLENGNGGALTPKFNLTTNATSGWGGATVQVNVWTASPTYSNVVLNYSSSANLPEEIAMGSMYLVTEDGDFNNSYLVLPASASFIQGDYIIYNGSNYIIRNEYTFQYETIVPTLSIDGRTFINSNMGLNSVFKYSYDYKTNTYTMSFSDIYDGIALGTFIYNSDNLYDVGSITWNDNVQGSYNYQVQTNIVGISTLFDSNINQIQFLPTLQTDTNGNVTSIPVEDFNTNFNTFVTLNIENSMITV